MEFDVHISDFAAFQEKFEALGSSAIWLRLGDSDITKAHYCLDGMLTGTDTHIRLPLPNKGKTNASAYGLGDALIDADGTYGWIADGNQYFWVTLEIHDASEKAAYESDPYDTAAGAFVVSGLSYGKYTTGPEAPSYKRGDVNNDGVVDEADLLAIRRHISGEAPLTDEAAFNAADVNDDGVVDEQDYQGVEAIISKQADLREITVGSYWENGYDLDVDFTSDQLASLRDTWFRGGFPEGTPWDVTGDWRDLLQEAYELADSVYSGNTERLEAFLNRMEELNEADEGASVTLGVIGGSITQGEPGPNSVEGRYDWRYSEMVQAWLQKEYPNVNVRLQNVALGGTSSDYGNFRLKTQLLNFEPDLVLVEYFCNDGTDAWSRESYETLLRRLLDSAGHPAVIAIETTWNDLTKADTDPEKFHSSLPAHMATLERYGVPLLSYRQAVKTQIAEGEYTWRTVDAYTTGADNEKGWQSDNVHPSRGGHELLANLVVKKLADVRNNKDENVSVDTTLPQPLYGNRLEDADMLRASHYYGQPGYEAVTTGTGWTTPTLPTAKDNAFDRSGQWRNDNAAGSITFEVTGGLVYLQFVFGNVRWENNQYVYEGGDAEIQITVDGEILPLKIQGNDAALSATPAQLAENGQLIGGNARLLLLVEDEEIAHHTITVTQLSAEGSLWLGGLMYAHTGNAAERGVLAPDTLTALPEGTHEAGLVTDNPARFYDHLVVADGNAISRAIKKADLDSYLAGGVTFAATYQGRLVYKEYMGRQNFLPETGDKAGCRQNTFESDSIMEMASVSKTVTAVLVMKLINDGVLNPTTGEPMSVHDPIKDYFPEAA